jgi:Dyp-type peroxidase family
MNKMNPPQPFLQKNLSYDGSEFKSIADDIQGNILKGHGRSHVTLVFFTFKNDRVAEAKSWLHTFGTTHVTTAAKQKEQTLDFQRTKKDSFFFGLYLTSSCYDDLSLSHKKPNDLQFRKGMAAADLQDPSVSKWDLEWQQPVHGCVLIAYNGERADLDLTAQFVKDSLPPSATVFEQKGDGLKNELGDNIEHFGYVDGISQPKFFKEETDNIPTTNWNPSASWDLVLAKEPDGGLGSYWVFRKLEQNVKAFKTHEKRLAHNRGLYGDHAEIVGAELVGRWENGMPRLLGTDDKTIGDYTIEETTISKINNFNYEQDTNVEKPQCPFSAHIRKVNPRIKGFPQIARRGIPYGTQTEESRDNPIKDGATEGVGLLFQCFQNNIGNQFEAMQKAANDPEKDPIIGCPKNNEFVKLKGGGYFFAPSLGFFKSLNLILSHQKFIENMNNSLKKGSVGDYQCGDSSATVYYGRLVSDLISEQLRAKIKEKVKNKLLADEHVGTPNQVLEILYDDLELADLVRKVAKIDAWYAKKHPNAEPMMAELHLKRGGDFEFVPNANHKPTAKKTVDGSRVVQCFDGLCCAGDSLTEEYLMVPSSAIYSTEKLGDAINTGDWSIYEVPKGTKDIKITIEDELYTFNV